MEKFEEVFSRARELLKQKKPQEALDLIEQSVAESERKDDFYRLRFNCLERLQEWAEGLKCLEAIRRPTHDDLEDLAVSYFVAHNYPAALKAIDKAILLEETAYRRFLRALILSKDASDSRGYRKLSKEELVAIVAEYARAAALPKPFARIFLNWAEVVSAQVAFTRGYTEELAVLENGLTLCESNDDREELSFRIAELAIFEKASRAFEVLKPLVLTKPEPKSEHLLLAIPIAIKLDRYDVAVTLIQMLPPEVTSLPGYHPVAAEVYLKLGRKEEAWECFDQAIISESPRAKVYGLLGRAKLCLESGDMSRAKVALENAVVTALDEDLLIDPYCGPYFQREFYHFKSDFDFITETLKISDPKKVWGEDLYWKLRYWALRIERGFDGWEELDESDAEEMGQAKFDKFNREARKARDELYEIGKHFMHPNLAGQLSEALAGEKEWELALKLGLSAARWSYALRKSKDPESQGRYAAIYFPDDLKISKEDALKIHQFCMKELGQCSDPAEVDGVFSVTYAAAWGSALKALGLEPEIQKATTLLVGKNPESQHPDVWWDYAYYADVSDPKCSDRQEYGYRKLLEQKPDDSSAAHNLALALRKLNRRDEAWEFSKKAFSLKPKDKIIADLYNQLAPHYVHQEAIASETRDALKSPVMDEDLTVRQRLYLAAFLRSCLTEDGTRILPAVQALSKIAPTSEYADRILLHLYETRVLVIDPRSPGTAVTTKALKSGKVKLVVEKPQTVLWVLNVRSRTRPDALPDSFMAELQDPPQISPEDLEPVGTELWHELGVEECVEHLEFYRGEVNLQGEVGDKTLETFSDLLKRYSTGQVVGLIKKKVPECLAAYESRKIPYRKQAANSVPGLCASYAEWLETKNWSPPQNARNSACEQSMISKILFDRLLELGNEGFYRVPGTFVAPTFKAAEV